MKVSEGASFRPREGEIHRVFGGTILTTETKTKTQTARNPPREKGWFDVFFFGEGDLHRTNPIGGKDVFCSFKFPWIQNKQLKW